MEIRSCVKLFILLSWVCGAATVAPSGVNPPAPQPSLAAETLKARGYSIIASVLVSLSTAGTNFSGTLLAPPDFAFSFATAKFLNTRRPPPRPSASLLLYHTIKPPPILTWNALSSRDDGTEFRTLYQNNCLFLYRSSLGGEVSISSSPFKNPDFAVKIRQPDIYVDDHLIVHGIDRSLDHTLATKCSSFPTVERIGEDDNSPARGTFLDHAARALRRRGFNVVAAAITARRSDLLPLTSVTVLAVADRSLFHNVGGFRFDFFHHVLPNRRHRLQELSKLAEGGNGTEIDTLAVNKTVLVHSANGAVSFDGVAVDGMEVHRNRWIIVIPIKASLDNSEDSHPNPPPPNGFQDSDHTANAQAPFSVVSTNGESNGDPYPPGVNAPSPAPALFNHEAPMGTPSPAPGHNATYSENDSNLEPVVSVEDPDYFSWVSPPDPSNSGVAEHHCDVNSGDVEGGDLFCPRELLEKDAYVEHHQSFDYFDQTSDGLTQSKKVKIEEKVNIADDLFFYT